LRDHTGRVLDSALVLCFPAPATATGEDLVELHCHGGRAVVAAVQTALGTCVGLRPALPGEFTRRALTNGRIDLLEAEGLADLLEAETEQQRRAAMGAVEGRVSRMVTGWLDAIAALSARVEAALDYAEEDDVARDRDLATQVTREMGVLAEEIDSVLAAPSVERLRDGVRVVIAGPPNAGKSTLLNRLSQRDAAIVSSISGTTRDRIEAPVSRAGLPFVLVDTAGLTDTGDTIEAIGVARAVEAAAAADILLWLGDDPPPRTDALWLHARADLPERAVMPDGPEIAIYGHDPASVEAVWHEIGRRAAEVMAYDGNGFIMRDRQRGLCQVAADALRSPSRDPLLRAEALAQGRRALAEVLGLDHTEAMLDALFSRFCLGK
jgi:tRNA modification GTPase